MHAIFCSMAALSVASLFYTWRTYHDNLIDKQRSLRKRVTYMLWVMANGVSE